MQMLFILRRKITNLFKKKKINKLAGFAIIQTVVCVCFSQFKKLPF